MKEYCVGLEFIDGNYDIRIVNANSREEAISKAIETNNNLVGHPYHPSAKKAISGEIN